MKSFYILFSLITFSSYSQHVTMEVLEYPKYFSEANTQHGYNSGKLLKKKVGDKFLFRFQMNDFDYLFLTISTKDLNKYPLIVHNCKEKAQEKEFDVLDLEEMWNNN